MTPFETALAGVKGQNGKIFDTGSLSFTKLNPWKLAGDAIVNSVQYVINAFRNAGEELKKQGKNILDEAKTLGAITEDVAGLKTAANAAGVSTQAYADWPRGEIERGWRGHRRWISGGGHSAWAWVRWRWASATSSVYARRYGRHSR